MLDDLNRFEHMNLIFKHPLKKINLFKCKFVPSTCLFAVSQFDFMEMVLITTLKEKLSSTGIVVVEIAMLYSIIHVLGRS